MLFTSLSFLCFLAVVLAAYYLTPGRWQPWILLAASLYLYYGLSHKMMVFILFSAFVGWATARRMDALNAGENQAVAAARAAGATREERSACQKPYQRKRRLYMLAAWGCNLGLLLYFKFFSLVAQHLAAYGAPWGLPALAMPLGVSFYTLQLLSYTMDVYSGRIAAQKNYLRVLLFTCYFPQIMQGPISRYDQLAPQLAAPHRFDWQRFTMGCSRILWGYFKKLVIADRLAILTRTLYNGYDRYTGFYVVVAGVLYTFQLYADFSGGIDIALGASGMLGIDLPENFVRPLFSKTIDEFWRRWHITLGAWLRDYIFYPVNYMLYPLIVSKSLARSGSPSAAKKRRPAARWLPSYIALLFLWFCSGIWHGEGWQYICYGLWHGLMIMAGNTIAKPSAAFWTRCGIAQDNRWLQSFRVARTFCIVVIGELMFGSSSFAMVRGLFRGLFAAFNPQILWDGSLLQLGLDGAELAVGAVALAVLAIASLASRDRPLREKIAACPLALRWSIYLTGLICVVVFGIYGANYPVTPFIYYQF